MNDAMNGRDMPLSWKIDAADRAIQSVVEHIEAHGWGDWSDAHDTILLDAILAAAGTLRVMRERHRQEAA